MSNLYQENMRQRIAKKMSRNNNNDDNDDKDAIIVFLRSDVTFETKGRGWVDIVKQSLDIRSSSKKVVSTTESASLRTEKREKENDVPLLSIANYGNHIISLTFV